MSHYNIQFPKYNIVVICEALDAVAALQHVVTQEFGPMQLQKLNGTRATFEGLNRKGFPYKIEAVVVKCGDPR